MEPARSASTACSRHTGAIPFRQQGERLAFGAGRICALPREEAGALVCAGYAGRYGADVRDHLMPCLLGLRDGDDRLAGVFGLRTGGERFYLEHYLSQPLNETIAAIDGRAPTEGELVELGNLVGRRPGMLRALVRALAPELDRSGCRWLACTATRELRIGLARAGADCRVLGPARADRLPAGDAGQWGSYYAHDPAVVLIGIRGTVQKLRHLERARAGNRRPGAIAG